VGPFDGRDQMSVMAVSTQGIWRWTQSSRVLYSRVMDAVTLCVSSALPTTPNSWNMSSSSFVGSPLLETSSGLTMACRRSLSGVAALQAYSAVEIGSGARFLSPGREHLWSKHEWRLLQNHVCRASPLFSTRACGNNDNLFSRRDSGTQWQASRNASHDNSRASGVCGATTSSQGVSANKVSFTVFPFTLFFWEASIWFGNLVETLSILKIVGSARDANCSENRRNENCPKTKRDISSEGNVALVYNH